MTTYEEFLKTKRIAVVPSGFNPSSEINPLLFDWQRDIVRLSLPAIFL